VKREIPRFARLLLLQSISTSLDGEGDGRPLDSRISRILLFARVLLLTQSISATIDDRTCEGACRLINSVISSFHRLSRVMLLTQSISANIDDGTCEVFTDQ